MPVNGQTQPQPHHLQGCLQPSFPPPHHIRCGCSFLCFFYIAIQTIPNLTFPKGRQIVVVIFPAHSHSCFPMKNPFAKCICRSISTAGSAVVVFAQKLSFCEMTQWSKKKGSAHVLPFTGLRGDREVRFPSLVRTIIGGHLNSRITVFFRGWDFTPQIIGLRLSLHSVFLG